ncbi:MAG: PHP domain-containing protein [Candidatus Altiarchaeota archaeon]|nr:PHP domain-containing protein [Candidatus Altiarchaeota archaeon]
MKIDFHVHTSYGEGKNTPAEMAAVAKKKGLDAIAITDNLTLEGWKNFTPTDFIIIPGLRIQTDKGGVLVYGIGELPSSNELDAIIDWAKDFGYLVIPTQFDDRLGMGELALKSFDVVEGINGSVKRSINEASVKKCMAAGKNYLCNSGAKSVSTLGDFYTNVDSNPNVRDILESIKKGKFSPRLKLPSLSDNLRSKFRL